MADSRISDYADAGALTGAELLELVQGGANKKITTANLLIDTWKLSSTNILTSTNALTVGGTGGNVAWNITLTKGTATPNNSLNIFLPGTADSMSLLFVGASAGGANQYGYMRMGFNNTYFEFLGAATIGAYTVRFRDTRSTTVGLEYVADYSAGYSTRSLVDKGYVTTATAGMMTLSGVQTSTGKKTFQAGSTNAGLNIGSFGGDPSTTVAGDVWFHSSLQAPSIDIGGGVFRIPIVGTTATARVPYFSGTAGFMVSSTSFTFDVTTGLTATAITLAAGTTTVAPIKMTSGTNLTTAVAGAFEYNGTNLFFTRTAGTRENVLVAVDNAAAPGTVAAGAVTNRYGNATNFLGDPNRWLSVNVLGTIYKIPLYT